MASFFFLLRKEFRDRYPTPFAAFGELFGLLASLVIYYFTSRAFSAQAAAPFGGHALTGAHSYFEYLVIGETALFVPMALFTGSARSFRHTLANGTWESMLHQPVRAIDVLLLLVTALIPLELARIFLTLASAGLVFGMFVGSPAATVAASLGAAFLLQLAAIPAFLGLAVASVGVLCRFGRGENFLAYAGAGASILAGAYFPLSVLPHALRDLSLRFSPFTLLLESTRQVCAGNFSSLASSIALLLAWGIACSLAGILIFNVGIARTRKDGFSELHVAR